SINGIPIFLQNRNGNTNAKWNQTEILKEIIQLAEQHGLVIASVRIDSAGYVRELLAYLHQKGIGFYIRPSASKRKTTALNNAEKKTAILGGRFTSVVDTKYTFGDIEYRLVARYD